MTGVILILALTALAALLAAIAQYIFKLHMKRFSFSIAGILDLLLTKQIILGLLIYGASFIIYLIALGHASLVFVYPAFSSSFIFVMLISAFYLKERISARRAAGMMLIVLGITLIALAQ